MTFGAFFQNIIYILLAILILLVMITVHEFGHYLTGKIFNFKIDEFSIGFGPKLFSKKKADGEIFSVRALPIGGFCAFSGEDAESDNPNAFNNKKPWQRIIVLIAGATMNFVLSVVLVILMFSVYGQNALMIGKTNGDSGFCDRDIILSANGKNIYMLTDLMKATENKNQGDTLSFSVYRNGKITETEVKLLSDTDYKNMEDTEKLLSALGVVYTQTENGLEPEMYSTGVKLGLVKTLSRSIDYSFKITGTIFVVIGELLTGALGISSLGGTVTTLSVAADAIKIGGFRYFLNIASFIGINLAVFNLLPIPALDGSRVVFTFIEWVRGKPVDRKVEGLIHTIGLVLLLVFAVFVDLQQCF